MLGLAALGGFLGLDGVSCLQSMVARPIVSGPLTGALLGDPVAGMWAGAVLELVSLKQLPIGANRPWDTGPAAVVATLAAVTMSPPGVALVIGVGWGVVVGWIGSWSIHALRRANERVVASHVGEPLAPALLERRHYQAMALDFARALALTLGGILGVLLLAPWLGGAPQGAVIAFGVVLFIAASSAIGVIIGITVRGRSVIGAFGLGIIVSAVITLWLR